jgi:hypothetical protein
MKTPFPLLLFAIVQAGYAADMTVLTYRDQDPGTPSYTTRVLVTPRFVRLDEGNDAGNFILLNRKTGDLVNVLHDTKNTMHIRNKRVPEETRPAWKVDERIEDVRPGTQRITLTANGTVCSQSVAAKKLLPDAAKALAEYKVALAWTQFQTYKNTPDDLRQDCDLVEHVWDTGRAMRHGLPIEERDYAGRVRVLEKQGREKLRAGLFRLPAGYAVTYATPE